MTDDFYAVAVPEQRQILGLQLRPLSLGHIILLHRVNSAFVSEGIADYKEVAIAALICSLSFEDGQACLADSDTPKLLQLLAEKITGVREWRVRLGLKKARIIDLPANISALSNYLKEGTSTPYYSFSSGDFKDVNLPSVQLVKVTLMRDMHFTEAEIMDRSWAICMWDFVTLKAVKGEVQIEDKEAIDDARSAGEKVVALFKEGKVRR